MELQAQNNLLLQIKGLIYWKDKLNLTSTLQ